MFVVIVTAILVPSGRALAVDSEMEPNSVLAVESFIRAQTTTPEDGRLHGYGFAAVITSTGTAEGATRLLSTLRPADGQRLVALALRFDPMLGENGTGHPVRATLVVDGRRSALDDGDFVRSGERMYAASVPRAAKQVDLEMSAAGLAQTFSLTEGHRVGDQPVVLYRDPAGPDVVSDINDERTLSATSGSDGAKGAVSVALKAGRLSYFSPGEPISTVGSPSRAFLIVEGTGDGVQPPYGQDDYGWYFSDFAAVPGSAVTARLPDGTVVEGRHAGSDEGLLGGWYYFRVPANLTSARLTIEPGAVDGTQYRGFVGAAARIIVDGEAGFDVRFGAPSTLAETPTTKPPTSADGPAGQRREAPAADNGGSRRLVALLGALVVALLVAGLFGMRRTRAAGRKRVGGENRTHTSTAKEELAIGPLAEPPGPEGLIEVMGEAVCLDGPGAADAARAAIVEALASDDEPRAVVVMATGQAANLLPPAARHPALRLVGDSDEVLRELEVVQLRRQRSALEAEELSDESPDGWAGVLVVAPAPLDRDVRARLDNFDNPATGRLVAAVICLGRDSFPLAFVDAGGHILTPRDESALRRVSMITEAELAVTLSRLAPSLPRLPDAGLNEPSGEVLGGETEPPVSVRILGAYRITARDAEVTTGLRAKARELLAFLVVNREGATMDAAIEALWPESDPEKGQAYFRTVVANLRTTLRAGAGLDDRAAVVERIGPRYRLDTDLLAVDLWQFTDGIAEVSRDGGAASQQKAADCYGGEFAAGDDFPWAEAVREQLRRKAIDTLMALAESLRVDGDLNGALRATEQAIDFDPFGEGLYQSAMKLQLSLGRRDAASQTLRLLEQRLADLDMRPQEVTRRLLSTDIS